MAASAQLKATLALNSASFARGMRSAIEMSQRLAGQAAITGRAVTGIGFIGAAAVAATFTKALKDGIDVASKYSDAAARIGDSAGSVAVLSTAFEAAGLTGEDLSNAIGRMQKALVDGNDAFGRLGLSIGHLRQLSPTQQFIEIGNKIAAIRDPAEKTALAMDLFGRSGAKLNQIFGDSGSLELATKALGSMKDILDASANSIDSVGDKVGMLGAKWDGLGLGLAAGVEAPLNRILEKILEIDTADIGRGLGQDIGNAISGREAHQAIADLGAMLIQSLAAAGEAGAKIMGAVLVNTLKEPIADIQARIQAAINNPGVAGGAFLGDTPVGKILGKMGVPNLAGSNFEAQVATEKKNIMDSGGPRVGFGNEGMGHTSGDLLKQAIADFQKTMASLAPETTKAALRNVGTFSGRQGYSSAIGPMPAPIPARPAFSPFARQGYPNAIGPMPAPAVPTSTSFPRPSVPPSGAFPSSGPGSRAEAWNQHIRSTLSTLGPQGMGLGAVRTAGETAQTSQSIWRRSSPQTTPAQTWSAIGKQSSGASAAEKGGKGLDEILAKVEAMQKTLSNIEGDSGVLSGRKG